MNDLVIPILIVILTIVIVLMLVYISILTHSHNKIIESIKKIHTINAEHAVCLVKLLYHQSIALEDFETAAKIKKSVPKDFDFYKILP